MKMQAQSCRKYGKTDSFSLPTKETSMCSLIIWNISKALENNPCMDLRHAIRSARERLGHESRDEAMISQPPEDRHLTCAILAWHQLGHKDTDSLYQFIEQNRNKTVCSTSKNYSNKENIGSVNKASVSSTSKNVMCNKPSVYSKELNFHTNSLMGPVVKLPVETKIVMRLENTIRHDCSSHSAKKTPKNQNDIMSKIDAACCMDKVCVQRLTELDTAVSALRSRAAKLARREAERVELLERAESAWKDLELGYQRRLNLAVEKEEDLAKQIEKTIAERNNYKNVCTNVADTLKERSELAEKERDRLTSIEKTVCERACVRLRLSEEAARESAELADQLCRANQLDRDLRFKEDQARRKVSALEGEVESVQCLTHEAERSMRAELSVLKQQVTQVADQLLAEQSIGKIIKNEVEELQKEKDDILEDLDGCKAICDKNMQGKIDQLKKKREELIQLKDKVVQCRCKLPLDATVEVKRTPSFAALCNCAPEDKFLDSCSCTSLRSQLLSNLLADLFGGLQSELDGSGSLMPCQLLKCLEDKHNWDRSSAVKTNLKNFFEQLLVGELDIAIATSIEKYHAKWVGASCADAARVIPDPGDIDEGWQNRAIERRAQKLANQLAEQLFKERAEQVTNKAKEIVTKGPPPCKCETKHAAVFPCFIKTPITSHSARKTTETTTPYLKRTPQDVTQLRVQIEDLKKEVIKKEDLRLMEEKIARIVKRASKPSNIRSTSKTIKNCKEHVENINENGNLNFLENYKSLKDVFKKKIPNSARQTPKQPSYDYFGRNTKRNPKLFREVEQSFAVNLCLCGTRDNLNQNLMQNKRKQAKNIIRNIPSFKKPKRLISKDNKVPQVCPSGCICFHKTPSNTSIDKLLEKLPKWKRDLHSSIVCDEKQEIQNSDIKLNINENHNLQKNDSDINSTTKKRKNNLLNYKSLPKYSNDVIEFYSTIEKHDKSTDFVNVLPTTTDSEYIAEINLDKSNDNSCKCAKYNRSNAISGDGKYMSLKTSFTCINTKMCKCKNTSAIKLNKNQSIASKVDLKKVSQVYSLKLQDPQFKCGERQLLTKNASNQSFQISGDSFVDDVLKQSDLLPCDCDFRIKLLGVTLLDTFVVNHNKKNIENNLVITQIGQDQNLVQKLKDHLKSAEIVTNDQISLSQSHFKLDKDKHELFMHVLSDSHNKSQINKTPDNGDIRQKCICCDNKDTEESNEMELNAFNLLEEHLKEKFAEFQRSSCKAKCISYEEEKILFSTILGKVKEIITENTNQLTCKCTGLNKESWERAYGLLHEYLKIKINRVQCSCISNNNGSGNVLPIIMDKLTYLIESDFERLKEKCKCEIKNEISNNISKDWKEQTTETILQYNDMFVQLDHSENNNKLAQLRENSIQVLSIPCDNKSCEVIFSDTYGVNTAEKKGSCQFRNSYITDCKCRQTNKEPVYFENNVFANSCIESIFIKDVEVKKTAFDTILKYYDSNGTSISSPRRDSSILMKNKLNNEFSVEISETKPYIGYTLSCSCDSKLGICYCNKSLLEINREKIDFLWKAFTNKSISKNVSYIMPKISAKITSDAVPLSISSGSSIKQSSIKSLRNVNILTSDNDEEVVLKMESKCSRADSSKNCLSIATECYKGDSSNFNEDFEIVSESNKKILFDSLFLSTDSNFNSTKHENFEDVQIAELKSECDCKKVPVCHVKMLMEEIEEKLVESKCTCDSLSSNVCPLYSEVKLNYN